MRNIDFQYKLFLVYFRKVGRFHYSQTTNNSKPKNLCKTLIKTIPNPKTIKKFIFIGRSTISHAKINT